jgi:3D (Asp-Asp-Asp) domain-containing protein
MTSFPWIRVGAVLIAASASTSLGCAAPESVPEGKGSTESHLAGGIGTVRVTHYTLAREADFASESDFLCSGRGVAMQGTGIRRDGSYVTYVSGGGGWCGNYARLCDCGSARFADSQAPTGASGRTVVKNYSIAVDPGVIPLGSYVWLGALGHWFRADDTGGAIKGMHVDVYTAEDDVSIPESSDAYVTSEPHEAGDPGPNGEAASAPGADEPPAPSSTIGPRPSGDFQALDVRNAIREGGYVTQCADDGASELVWQTTNSGKDLSSRWAEAKYPQAITGDCGDAPSGVHPLVLRSEADGALDGTWISQCAGDGQARVFRVESGHPIDGHPTASFLYSEEDASCSE